MKESQYRMYPKYLLGGYVCREIGWFQCFVYFLVGWHDNTVRLPLGDVIFAQLTCPPE